MVIAAVQRWQPIVAAELAAQSIPLPNELILAVMQVESGGSPGIVNPKSGASGLLQVMPGTLADYNKRHGSSITLDEMRGKTDSDAAKQIKVGIDIVATYWRSAYKYLAKRWNDVVPIYELAHIADLFYVAGPGATRAKMDKLPNPTWAAIQAAYPSWNALPHPKKVLAEPKPWNIPAIESWLNATFEVVKDPKKGFALGILILMGFYWWTKGRKI